ncbi:MAG: Vitamin B12 import ATP-binding protein BtuD [Chlamydiales bacterium]|nr:Vitamin B12 import ATP-binding protein BtuD [Chlamydiales bacterium]
MLQLNAVHFRYQKKNILKGVSFSVKEGEILVLIGTSGSGKTTLFRLITGLISPLQGSILIKGQAHQPQLTTYMRQEDLLLPWRTVLSNLLLGSELSSQEHKNARPEALKLLSRLGLAGYEEAYPHELSGGMKQRVSLARSLLQHRPLMLLDEPFASLDVIIREQLYSILKEIREQYKKTIVMVTHDFRDAISIADRILVLSAGQISGSYPINREIQENASLKEALMDQIRSNLAMGNCA